METTKAVWSIRNEEQLTVGTFRGTKPLVGNRIIYRDSQGAFKKGWVQHIWINPNNGIRITLKAPNFKCKECFKSCLTRYYAVESQATLKGYKYVHLCENCWRLYKGNHLGFISLVLQLKHMEY